MVGHTRAGVGEGYELELSITGQGPVRALGWEWATPG